MTALSLRLVDARWREAWLLAAVVILAAALRLQEYDRLSFWFDEAATVHFARMAPWELWGRDTHPPLYYLLIHFWLLLGDSEWWLRLFSLLVSLGTLVAVYVAGRALGGPRLGLLVTLLLAVAGFELRFAQEARMYALLCASVALALSGLVPLLADPAAAASVASRWCWRRYVVGSVLAVYSHNMGVLWPLAATGAALLVFWPTVQRPALARRWLKVNLLVLLLWCPYWPWLLHQASVVLSDFHLSQPTAHRLFRDLAWIHLGIRQPEDLWELLGVALGLVPLALGLCTLRARLGGALLLLALLPPVATLLWGSLFQPLYANRILVWTALPSALAAAAGFDWLLRRGRSARLLAALLLLAVLAARTASLQVYIPERQKADWRAVTLELAATLPADATVVLSPGFEDFSWTYYKRRLAASEHPLQVRLVPLLVGRQAEAMAVLIERAPEQVTFILSRWFGPDRLIHDPQEFLERTLGCAQLLERREYMGIHLWRFATGAACARTD